MRHVIAVIENGDLLPGAVGSLQAVNALAHSPLNRVTARLFGLS
jgi:hypothetical protein